MFNKDQEMRYLILGNIFGIVEVAIEGFGMPSLACI